MKKSAMVLAALCPLVVTVFTGLLTVGDGASNEVVAVEEDVQHEPAQGPAFMLGKGRVAVPTDRVVSAEVVTDCSLESSFEDVQQAVYGFFDDDVELSPEYACTRESFEESYLGFLL